MANSIGKAFQDVECFSGNLSELLKEFRENHVDPATGKLNVDSFEEGVDVAQLLWNKIKETSVECTGNEIEVKLGDDIPSRLLGFFLLAVGFKL